MLYSQHKFNQKLKNSSLIILLLGPSGVGKTEWTKKFQDINNLFYPNFKTFEMDERIGKSQEMKEFLKKIEGETEAEKMGIYFGKPWGNPKDYAEKEKFYLKIEATQIKKITKKIKTKKIKQAIIDLTGSAIYCHQELKELLKLGISIYLQANAECYSQMMQNYLDDPKPVCWDTVMQNWLNGDKFEELPDVYKNLLNTRNELYLKSADIVLPWEKHRENLTNAKDFIEEIKKELKT